MICTAVWLRPRKPPPPIPPHWDSYTRALLVSKDRRHLFVTPWVSTYKLAGSSTTDLLWQTCQGWRCPHAWWWGARTARGWRRHGRSCWTWGRAGSCTCAGSPPTYALLTRTQNIWLWYLLERTPHDNGTGFYHPNCANYGLIARHSLS